MKNQTLIIISTIVIIAVVLSGVFVYINYPALTGTSQGKISVVDDEGTTVTLNSPAQRVVSLAPSNTQIMFAIGAGDKVVGLTDYDNYPYNFSAWIAAGNMTSIGGYSTPNKEAIASLHPDLILATPINDPDVINLRGLGYTVLVLNPNDVQGVLYDISIVGKATGTESAADALINQINNDVDAIQAKITNANIATKPRVYYEIWWNPEMSAGGTSWVNDIINKAGGINIFAGETQQWPTVSSETVVQMNPDVILLPTGMGSGTFYGSVDDVKARPGWSAINAVKNNRIVVIDGDLFAEVGPRAAEQITAIANALYPDLFN